MDSSLVLEILQRMGPEFKERGVDLVVLFGSHARGTAGPRSDIDIGIQGVGPVDRLFWTCRFMQAFGCNEIDVIDLRRASAPVAYRALSEGVVVYASSGTVRARELIMAWMRYHDTEKLRRAQARSIERFVALHGVRP
jgi:predicted nucleotidyltransferase